MSKLIAMPVGCQPSSYSHIVFKQTLCLSSFDLLERVVLALFIRFIDDLESRPEADGVGEVILFRIAASDGSISIRSMKKMRGYGLLVGNWSQKFEICLRNLRWVNSYSSCMAAFLFSISFRLASLSSLDLVSFFWLYFFNSVLTYSRSLKWASFRKNFLKLV